MVVVAAQRRMAERGSRHGCLGLVKEKRREEAGGGGNRASKARRGAGGCAGSRGS